MPQSTVTALQRPSSSKDAFTTSSAATEIIWLRRIHRGRLVNSVVGHLLAYLLRAVFMETEKKVSFVLMSLIDGKLVCGSHLVFVFCYLGHFWLVEA